ncbi:MAG: antitoxin [Vicinamibacterales bacterium]
MRTTVTLDPDVAAKVQAVARERGIGFKEALNSLLRVGLAEGRSPTPFTVHARPMGLRGGIDLDRALQLASDLEDAETLRKLDLRK